MVLVVCCDRVLICAWIGYCMHAGLGYCLCASIGHCMLAGVNPINVDIIVILVVVNISVVHCHIGCGFLCTLILMFHSAPAAIRLPQLCHVAPLEPVWPSVHIPVIWARVQPQPTLPVYIWTPLQLILPLLLALCLPAFAILPTSSWSVPCPVPPSLSLVCMSIYSITPSSCLTSTAYRIVQHCTVL